MKSTRYPRIDETLMHETLPNGLNVYVIPKKDYQQSYAFFATNYGSIDLRFCLGGSWQDTPAGVAHFLEHKMFDKKDGNALQELSKNGASPNAFTSFQMTAYHFECTGKFEENLRILLDFVSQPYFTPESVSKEQGIIGQEIRMYEDSPDWRAYENLFTCLYENHPVRINIAGTIESIAKITDKTLYDCHRAFYNPSNMVLCVAGDVDAARVVALAREILPEHGLGSIERDYGTEDPARVLRHEMELKMEVSMPMFMLGAKSTPAKPGFEAQRLELLAELACQALCGVSSPLYADLYDHGLINRGFEGSYMDFPGGACLMFGGESKDPRAVRAQILDEAARVSRSGFDGALFDRLKKALFGERLRQLNELDNICYQQAGAHFLQACHFDFPELFDSITAQDAAEYIAQTVTPERCALSLILPVQGV